MQVSKPEAGEDCRTLWRNVCDLVNGTNSLLNMVGIMEGEVRGIGRLSLKGGVAELVIKAGGDGEIFGAAGKRDPTMTLVSLNDPSDLGTPVQFQVGINADATGNISFYIGHTLLSVNGIVNGVATSASKTDLSPGQYLITAVYGGDGSYNSARSSLTQVVNSARPPIVQVAAVPNPALKGYDAVTFLANVIAQDPIPPAPNITGNVRFFIDGSNFEDDALAYLRPQTWRASSSSINYLSFGPHTIIGRYLGDTNYGQAAGSVVLYEIWKSTVSLTINPNPAFEGDNISFNVSVAHYAGLTPTGTVQIIMNGTAYGPATGLVNGVATITAPAGTFPLGPYNTIARYSGDSNFGAADSGIVAFNVVADALILSGIPQQIIADATCGNHAQFGFQYHLRAPTSRTHVYVVTTDPYGSGNGTIAVNYNCPGVSGGFTDYFTSSYPGVDDGWLAINRDLDVLTRFQGTSVGGCFGRPACTGVGYWRFYLKDDPFGGGNVIPFFYNAQQLNSIDIPIYYSQSV